MEPSESEIPNEPVTLKIGGKYIAPREMRLGLGDRTQNLKIAVEFVIPPIHESLVINATVLEPSIDRRDDVVYKSTLFSRDDQVFQTLDAGLSLGQHEGGGKSLEVRRFGFNMDHGGVNGGLKVLVDNVQQNQATQGHGQGYLGQLKSLTPELVQEVSIINGPFSPEYGDFSGLGWYTSSSRSHCLIGIRPGSKADLLTRAGRFSRSVPQSTTVTRCWPTRVRVVMDLF